MPSLDFSEFRCLLESMCGRKRQSVRKCGTVRVHESLSHATGKARLIFKNSASRLQNRFNVRYRMGLAVLGRRRGG